MGLDVSALRKKLNELTNRGSTRSDIIWKPQEGQTTVRIVPYNKNPTFPFIELYFHYFGGKTQISPMTFDEPDPIVEFCHKLRAPGNLSKEEYRETKKFEGKLRTFVPVIVRGEENLGVRFWGFGKTVFTDLLSIMDDEDYGDITHPLTGRDLKVEFIPKEKSDTSFPKTKVRIGANETPLHENKETVKKFLMEQPDIFEAYDKPTYDDLKEFLENYLAPINEEVASEDDEWGSPYTSTDDDDSSEPTATVSSDVEAMFDKMFND